MKDEKQIKEGYYYARDVKTKRQIPVRVERDGQRLIVREMESKGVRKLSEFTQWNGPLLGPE